MNVMSLAYITTSTLLLIHINKYICLNCTIYVFKSLALNTNCLRRYEFRYAGTCIYLYVPHFTMDLRLFVRRHYVKRNKIREEIAGKI